MKKYKYLKLLISMILIGVFLIPSTVGIYAEPKWIVQNYSGSDALGIEQMKKAVIIDKQRELVSIKLTPEEKEIISQLKKDSIRYYLNEDFLIEVDDYAYDIQFFYIELIESVLGIEIEVIHPIDGVKPVEAINQDIADLTMVSDYVVMDVPNVDYTEIFAIEKLYLFGSEDSITSYENKEIVLFKNYNKYADLYLDSKLNTVYYNDLSKEEQFKYKEALETDSSIVGVGNYREVLEMAHDSGAYLVEHPSELPLKFVSSNTDFISLVEKINFNIDSFDLYTLSRVFNNKKLQILFLELLDEEETKIIGNIDSLFYYDDTISELAYSYMSYYYTYIDTLVQIVTGVGKTNIQKYKLPDEIMYLSNLVVKLVIDENYNIDNNYYETRPFTHAKIDLFTINTNESTKNIYEVEELKLMDIGVLNSQKDVLRHNMLNKYDFYDFDRVRVYDNLDDMIIDLINNEIEFCITFPGIYESIKYNVYEKYKIHLYNNNHIFENEAWVFATNSKALTSVLDKYILLLEQDKFYRDNIINNYMKNSVRSIENNLQYKLAITVGSIGLCLALFYLLKTYDIRDLIEKSKKYDQEKGVYSKFAVKDYIENMKSEYLVITIKLSNLNNVKNIYSEEEMEELEKILVYRLKTLNFNSESDLFKISNDEYYIVVSKQGDRKQELESKLLYTIKNEYDIFGKEIIINYKINVINSSYIKRDKIPICKFAEYMYEHTQEANRRNDILYFKNYMYVKLVNLIKLEHAISNFDLNAIEPFYQPIANVVTGEITGCETYSGIIIEDKLYAGEKFAELIKKINQVKLIDEYLLNIVLTKRENLINRKIIDEDFTFSIRVSESFIKALTSELLDKLCKYHNLKNLSFVVFDIPEDMINNDIMSTKIDMIRKYRIKIGLESNSTAITILNAIDTRKIDIMKFNKDIVVLHNKNLINIIKQVINLPALECMCKNVESSEEYTYLKKLGFRNLQGPYFSEPKSYDELVEYLRL